jgi:8-oxo-dGTP pyrophosphatase MutT (NUDIX family)
MRPRAIRPVYTRKNSRRRPRAERKTLYYEGFPIRAAGLILYRVDPITHDTLLLLQRRNGVQGYEDLGGKVEHQDKTIQHTMAREAMEETRGLLTARDLLHRLQTQPTVYFPSNNKYVFTMLPATPEEQLTTFPGMEWVSVQRLTARHLFVRLRQPHFLEVLGQLRQMARQA